MKFKSAIALIFLLSSATISGFAQSQEKNQHAVVTIADDGFISFIGEESLALLFGEEVLLEVLGGESIVSIVGEKGSDKIIGEKGSDKIIGEKGSDKIIGEKGRVVRGVKTGRTVQFVGSDSAAAAVQNKLNIGSRLRVKSGNGFTPTESTYTLFELAMTNACCSIVKVMSDGNVLAEDRATRDSFVFYVPDIKIRRTLRPGQSVSTDGARRWAFIRTSAVLGIGGQLATYSFPIRRDSDRTPSTPDGGRRH